MIHARHINEAQLDSDSVVTIGVFDGVHIGHQTMVKRLVAEALTSKRQAIVITFHPHPDKVLRDVEERYYLTTPEQRARLLMALGVDAVITHPFDDDTRRMTAAEFVGQLTRRLRMKELWVGADFALGHEREGTVDYLRNIGSEVGFGVTEIELIISESGGETIHSSQAREHLRRGGMREVNSMLGRAFSLEGKVIRGQQRGRTIGVPTANLALWREQIIPANGVYAGMAKLGGERFLAATNIGMRPTFGEETLSVEAHLLDFNRDIYDETLELSFEVRLRPEKRFSGLEELLAQIRVDIAETRRLLSGL